MTVIVQYFFIVEALYFWYLFLGCYQWGLCCWADRKERLWLWLWLWCVCDAWCWSIHLWRGDCSYWVPGGKAGEAPPEAPISCWCGWVQLILLGPDHTTLWSDPQCTNCWTLIALPDKNNSKISTSLFLVSYRCVWLPDNCCQRGDGIRGTHHLSPWRLLVCGLWQREKLWDKALQHLWPC